MIDTDKSVPELEFSEKYTKEHARERVDAGFNIFDCFDFIKQYAMWMTYILRKKSFVCKII